MFKGRPCLPSALLALTLSLLAAQAARAQAPAKASAALAPAAAGADTLQSQQQPSQGVGRSQQQQQQQQQGTSPQQQPTPTPTPLKAGEKVARSFRAAFLRPTPYLMSAFTAGITQIGEDRLPHKDTSDELADWGSRAARSFATRTTTTIFASGVYPALFRQDPRYERSQSKKVGGRVAHALSRVFVTRDDDGNLEPNYSRFAGAFTASALANVWERSTPGHDRIGTDATFKRFGRSFISAAIGNIVLKEFGPDIVGIFRR